MVNEYNRGLLGGRLFRTPENQVAELSEKQKQSEEEYNQRQDAVPKILSDYKDDTPRRIIGLIKVWIPLDADLENVILSLDNSQKVVDTARKKFSFKKGKKADVRQEEIDCSIKIYNEIQSIGRLLQTFSEYVDMAIKYHAPKPLYPDWRKVLPSVGVNSEKGGAAPIIPLTPDGEVLRKFITTLLQKAKDIYNDRPVIDDDTQATAKSYFNIQRVKNFIYSLPNIGAKLAYLYRIKTEFQGKDTKAETIPSHSDKAGVFPIPRLHFFQELQNQIDLYEQIYNKTSYGASIANSAKVKTEDTEQEQEDSTDTQGSKHIEPRNQRQVYFALRILLSYSSKGMSEKKKIMSFLSGFGKPFFEQANSKRSKWNNLQRDFDAAVQYVEQFGTNKRMREEIEELKKDIEESLR